MGAVTSSVSPEAALELAALLDQVSAGDVGLADVFRIEPAQIEPLVDRALGLAGAGQLDAAAALLRRLAAVDGRSALLPYLLAAVYAEGGRHAEAAEACQDALRRDGGGPSSAPFRGEVELLRGRSLRHLGRIEAAKAALEVAAGLDGPARSAAQVMLQAIGDEA